MTLGRSSSGAIKIKTDEAGGGLRAVNCACCVPPGPEPYNLIYTEFELANGLVTAEDLPSCATIYDANGNLTPYQISLQSGYYVTCGPAMGNCDGYPLRWEFSYLFGSLDFGGRFVGLPGCCPTHLPIGYPIDNWNFKAIAEEFCPPFQLFEGYFGSPFPDELSVNGITLPNLAPTVWRSGQTKVIWDTDDLYEPTYAEWRLYIEGQIYTKTGLKNTPVGTYGPYSVT